MRGAWVDDKTGEVMDGCVAQADLRLMPPPDEEVEEVEVMEVEAVMEVVKVAVATVVEGKGLGTGERGGILRVRMGRMRRR